MPEFDKDLLSIQQARTMILLSREAQKKWATATQAEVDRVCEAMADAAYKASERLGRLAAEETGFGTPEHKKIKNQFGSKYIWESIKDTKTVGVIDHDPVKQITKIAWPMGIVAALIAVNRRLLEETVERQRGQALRRPFKSPSG